MQATHAIEHIEWHLGLQPFACSHDDWCVVSWIKIAKLMNNGPFYNSTLTFPRDNERKTHERNMHTDPEDVPCLYNW